MVVIAPASLARPTASKVPTPEGDGVMSATSIAVRPRSVSPELGKEAEVGVLATVMSRCCSVGERGRFVLTY